VLNKAFESLVAWFRSRPVPEFAPAAVAALPPYLDRTWAQRKGDRLAQASDWLGGGFAQANAAYVHDTALTTGEHARLHVAFNIGTDALREFVQSDDYKNVYEHPVVEGKELRPSKKRMHVDRIVVPGDPRDCYFCALTVGGTGMRFYGEYCVVLRSPDDAASVKYVLDGNSYDLAAAPLAQVFEGRSLPEQREVAGKLMCSFRTSELGDMLAIKVLQHHNARPRLFTIGAVGEAILSDEDYVEAFHEGKIRLATVLEVRSHPEDEMTESSIEDRYTRGEAVTAEELQWVARRQQAREALDSKSIRHRVVSGNGRGRRWR